MNSNNIRLKSGIVGLDEVLDGGYLPNRSYLIRGEPGTGKTTLGFHFLAAGIKADESSLFITLEESIGQLQGAAQSIGINLSAQTFLDLSPTSDFFSQVQTYDIFTPAEVEREPITSTIVEKVRALKPQRIFIDSITQFRYFSADIFQFRKQVLSFLRFLRESGATILFTSENSQETPDNDLQFMGDGVLNLSFEKEERALYVSKFRGSGFRSGHHSIQLTQQGMLLYPKLTPDVARRPLTTETISSGIPEIDELLKGGIERSAITIITGPSGVGKSTLGIQFIKEAAGRGERSVVYSFEESKETLLHRSRGINIAVDAMLGYGTLSIVQVEPLQYSPDEFAHLVRQEVEQHNTRIVMIDSLAGYRLSVRGQNLVENIHALCKYLQNMGVAVLLINEVENITGNFKATEVGVSYLADNIIFLRYLEINGELRRAIGVLKKRMSDFEKQLRAFEISRYGLKVGQPLSHLRGILSGVPTFINNDNP